MGIEVKNLTLVYAEGLPDESVALDDVSFELNKGDFVGIIGHTGSGKSTLLATLDGLTKPKSGHIVIDDVDITDPKADMLACRRKIGLVFQYPEYQLFEETVNMDVAFGPKNLGVPEEEIPGRVAEALRLVGMDPDEIGEVSPFELSGGQKRRVAIAGVVAMKPEVLILDEPVAGLDPKAHRDVLEMIKSIHEKQQNITILVSHSMSDVAKYCNRVLVMNRGKLVMQGTPAEVFARAEELSEIGLAVPRVAGFMRRLKDDGVEQVDLDNIPLDVPGAAAQLLEMARDKGLA